jgi:hypothetical protein
MLPGLILLAITAAPAAGAGTTPAPERARFQGLFVDWNSANRQSIATERQATQRPALPAQPADGAAAGAGSAALGERVGDVVALGDCAEGERIARAAGDFALVAAVRAHCTAADRQR